MRTKEQFKNDTYILHLIKEVSVFTMMAYGFANEIMMNALGPIIAFLAVAFMFIPRVVINDLLDKDSEGTREIKQIVVPEWKRKMNIALNILKFICLIILTLFIFFNTKMMDVFGTSVLWIASCFMVIPRKIINMLT